MCDHLIQSQYWAECAPLPQKPQQNATEEGDRTPPVIPITLPFRKETRPDIAQRRSPLTTVTPVMEDRLSRECWPCRNRHVRCDQSRMPCDKCLKAGLECSKDRPIRWVEGVAIRGKMQGRKYRSEDPPRKPPTLATKKSKSVIFKTPITRSPTRPVSETPKPSRVISRHHVTKPSKSGDDGTCITLERAIWIVAYFIYTDAAQTPPPRTGQRHLEHAFLAIQS